MANTLEIRKEHNELHVSYRWWTPKAIFLTVFAVIWNAIILFFLTVGAGFFIGIHLLVGLFLAWFVLTRFLNKTELVVNQKELTVKHGPVPWPFVKDRQIEARSLVQLYVEKSSVKVNNRNTFNLTARLDSGAKVTLLGMEEDRQKLLDLEHAIEAYLQIENEEMLNLHSETPYDRLDLAELQEKIKQFEPIKEWLPAGMQRKIEETQQKVLQRVAAREGHQSPGRHGDELPSTVPPSIVKTKERPNLELPKSPSRPGWGEAKPIPPPTNAFNFPLYRAEPGTTFSWAGQAHKIVATRQIDFTSGHTQTGRRLEVRAEHGGATRYLYAQDEGDRWMYYEERQLDELELNKLGFGLSVTNYPMQLRNGEDRYYPRDEQIGTRYTDSRTEAVRQFIYFTTASGTQFRGIEPANRGWEVYVMEVVDAGTFEENV